MSSHILYLLSCLATVDQTQSGPLYFLLKWSFLHFWEYLPFEEDLALYLNNTRGWFIPSLFRIGQSVLEKNILKNCQCIFTILLLSLDPWAGRCPSFKQFWIPCPQEWFVPSLVKIGPVVLEKKSKTDRRTDGGTNRRLEKLTRAQVN
jgi:hypothetical protein